MPTLEAVRATETAFTEDVCLHPGDDTPRLILADWLDEHGQGQRAEFIRVQCELAGRGPRATVRANGSLRVKSSHDYGLEALRDDVRELALRRRERELLDAHRREWLTEAAPPGVRYWQNTVAHGWALPMPAGDGGLAGVSVVFRRGFVEEVTLTVADFLAHAATLFRAAPVRRVTLFGGEPSQYPGLSGRGWWYWPIAPPVSADPRRVPLALWNLLEAHERCDDGAPLWCSRTAALDALAAACLLYGRRAAWPCPECSGTEKAKCSWCSEITRCASLDCPLPRDNLCPVCRGRGHTVEEG